MAAIGAAGTGLIPMAACMSARDGVALNLYLPGEVRAETESGTVRLRTETAYPADGRVRVTVDAEGEFTLYLRIPAWSRTAALSVNGEALEAGAGYARVRRVWRRGDVVELTLDLRTCILRAAELDPDANEASRCHAALLRGPIVLARDARFGEEVGEAVTLADEDGYAVTEAADAPFDCLEAFRVRTAEGEISVADYASCGRDWDLPMSAWITTR